MKINFLSSRYKFESVPVGTIISRVIFNDPATIILWADGTKTVAKTHGDDAFDPEKGFAVACAKKLLGNGEAFRTELAKWMTVEETKNDEPEVNGFRIGDRVEYDGSLGTVIAFALSGDNAIGVEFDESGIGFHNCGGVILKAGHRGTNGTSKWLYANELKHFENHSLTEDELYAMQGKKVWLVSLDEDGNPNTDDEKMKKYDGWHTVKGGKLYNEDDEFYDIKDINSPYGFRAYRESPKK